MDICGVSVEVPLFGLPDGEIAQDFWTDSGFNDNICNVTESDVTQINNQLNWHYSKMTHFGRWKMFMYTVNFISFFASVAFLTMMSGILGCVNFKQIVQIILFKHYCSKNIVQKLLFKHYCSKNIVQKLLFKNYCSNIIVQKILFKNYCSKNIVQKLLFKHYCSNNIVQFDF